MKLEHLILTVGCIIGTYIIWKYMSRKEKSYYTTPGGQWVLKWDAPSGTPPFSYLYKIVDETGNVIVNSSTTDTTLLLNPALFIKSSAPGSVMSDKRYTATVTPVNSIGTGPTDTITFQIYDTPSMGLLEISGSMEGNSIYPTSGGESIFLYNKIRQAMHLILDDRVTAANLKVSITADGKTYTPTLTPFQPNASGEATSWGITWCPASNPGSCPAFNQGDQATITISATNPGGTFTWTNTYTAGPPASIPGDIQANALFITS